jgi:hypothetical protein
MADKKEEVTKAAPAAEETVTPDDNGAKVEKVAVEVEKAENDAVKEAMDKVAATVSGIAKQLGVEAETTPADTKPTQREIVEKSLKDAGLDEEAIKKALIDYDAAAPEAPVAKAEGEDNAEGAEDSVEKAEGEDKAEDAPAASDESVEKAEGEEAADVLTQLEEAIAKAKRFTPARMSTLEKAVEELQKLLAGLQPQKPKMVSTPKNTLPAQAQVNPAGLTQITKALEEMTSTLNKAIESQQALAGRVEEIEKARTPSKAIETDGSDEAEIKKDKGGLWTGVL